MTEQPKEPKKWYKRKVVWASVAAIAAAVFDLSVGEQSAIAEILTMIAGLV